MSSFVTAGGDIGNGELLAQNAQNTANDAKDLAGTADNNIKNINDPNFLSPFEKPQLEIQMDNFATIYAADKDIATAEGIDFTAYDAAYQAYVAYMTPLVADISTYSPIVRDTFNSMVTAVQVEQKRFNAATQAQYNQQMNQARTDINDGQTKYKALQSEAKIMESRAAGIADTADRAISSAGFASNASIQASQAASSALASAINAQTDADAAVAKAESTASAFGPVKQSADSAFSNAMSAESTASSAVSQASSAAADSKDAKQIAGAVSQSYKTLTDGSTMTIAELQNGLAAKLTKTDLNGYATQDWAQNQIKVTADGINGTMSSIKSTVDGHTTDVNNLKVDSKNFKEQFTTVTDAVGKHTKDISALKVSSKELVSNFDSVSTANSKNEHNISELKQNAQGFSSTLETVQTQIQNSAVGTNLLANTADNGIGPVKIQGDTSSPDISAPMTRNDSYIEITNSTVGSEMYYRFCGTDTSMHNLKPGQTYTIQGEVYVSKGDVHFRSQYEVNGGWIDYPGCQSGDLATNTSGFVKVKYTFTVPSNATAFYLSWQIYNYDSSTVFRFRRTKLEIGSNATDYSTNPFDNATVTAVSHLSRTVDDMKYDISKKIEGKDLNGYATETWANNKIKVSVDGINGTISTVKHAVDGQTTSINDLKADSSSFKSQFTTVNDTLGKQTTDIGSLQASSKELTIGFDKLTTANGTNEHNISELKQSAEGFSSTLETVQTQVQNSAVGTNLLKDSGFESGKTPANYTWSSSVIGAIAVSSGGETFPKPFGKYMLKIESDDTSTVLDQSILYPLANAVLIKSGETWTYSYYYASAGSARGQASDYLLSGGNSNPIWGLSMGHRNRITTGGQTTWHRFTVTFTANTDIKVTHLRFGFVKTNASNHGWLCIDNIKLERGNIATDWCANPEDNATVTALTHVKQTADSVQALASNNQGNIAKLQITAKGIQTNVDNKYSDLKSKVSQTNSAWQVALSNSGQTNLVYNSEFANKAEGWTATSQGYLANDPAGTYQGSPSLGINTTNTGWTEFGRTKLYKLPDTIVRDDNTYSASAMVKPYGETTDNNALGVALAYFDSNQNRLTGWHDMMVKSKTSTRNVWTLVKFNDYKVPANALYVGLQFQVYNIAGTVKGVISHPMITFGPTVGTYNSDSASQADITALADDIDLRVKKGDVVNQLNIDAGGALLQTVGDSTKIVFASPNIFFDTVNPVQIPNVNIPGTLTGKTIEASEIRSTTTIKGSDIEAPIIHSPSGSFKLDGKTGDIIGASIHSADNSWVISKAGKVTGASITASVMDISGDGGGPDFDNIDNNGVTPDTAEGIYSRYKYTVDAGYDTGGMHRKLYKNGFLVINGDTFLDRAIGDWSADGGSKYVYDTMYEAHTIKMRAYAYTGNNVQTDDPTKTQGSLSDRLDITPKAITMGTNWSTNSPSTRITSDGGAKFGNFYFNSGHTMQSMDGGAIYLESQNDGMVDLHVQKLYQSSLLSLKTDITDIDPHDALNTIVGTDVKSYHFKTDDTNEPKSVSPILDDINPIPKYNTPDIFKSADGKSRSDGNIVGYLMLSVKDLNSRLQKLEGVN